MLDCHRYTLSVYGSDIESSLHLDNLADLKNNNKAHIRKTGFKRLKPTVLKIHYGGSSGSKSCPTLTEVSVRLLCLWDSPGKNTRIGSHSLLQGFFLIQGSNLGLLHCRQILCCLSHQGSPLTVLGVCWPVLSHFSCV